MDTKIIQAAEKYRDDMTKFLRDMIAIPSESCHEKEVIQRIKQEMEKVGIPNQPWTATEIQCYLTETVVHRQTVAVSFYSALIT